MCTNVSEEHVASIFWAEVNHEEAACSSERWVSIQKATHGAPTHKSSVKL
jgi:hypothetical protein